VNPSGIAAGAGFLWVTNEGDGTVTRFRPKSHTVDSPIRVGNSPAGVAIVDGAAWVANNLDGSLSRIDVDDLSVTSRTLAKAGGAYGVAAAPGTVWVSNEHAGNLMRLTTNDFTVVDTVNVGGAPLGLAFVGDDLWFTSAGGGRALHRGGVLTAVGTALTDTPNDPAVLDPTLSYDGDSWRLASVLHDGLVGFRHSGGVEGTQLVPDLATALPAPTDGGRTYTFHVRKGIKYSNGTVVRPGDIRRGIERTVAHDDVPFDYYASAIVGGQTCRDAIQRATAAKRARPDCNLSKGIVADDESGTVTFHLTRPTPEFLYQLALPNASAVPQRTPLDLMRGSFLPSTGPYTVKTYTPKGVGRDGKPSRGRLELVRNTFFREWSRAAQPAGYVDRILVETGYTEEQAVRLVIDGRADLLWRELGAGLTDLATRYGSLLHTTSGVGTLYLFLNTRRPPFDNIDARRAVAFALDRKALMSGDGELFDGPATCQLIPPGFAGYKPYCPFTLGSGDNRARWTAPDRAQARRLVQVSRTGGAKVTLGVFDDPHFRAATERVADVLRDLGYHPELREEAQDRYFTLATDPNKPFNAGLAGWYADYPAASNYIGTIASCLPGIGFFNASGYCDEEIDKGIAAAFQQQVSEPGKASDLWAELDRKVVDKAATIPFGNNMRDDFVSRRAGNVLIQKGTGPVISQMWVQ
jgi:ABC-type transport system substrate-binding protein